MWIQAISPINLAYNNPLTKEQIEYYALQLRDLNPKTVSAAVGSLINKNKIRPTVAEIREECARVSDMVNGRNDKSVSAAEAWGKVNKAISAWGHDRALDHMDEVTRKVAERFGWDDLCYGDVRQVATRRAQFMRIYDAVTSETRDTNRIMAQIESIGELNAAYQKKVAMLADVKKLEGGND